MKIGNICYVPPKGVLNSQAFMGNITKFPAKHPLFVISDDQSNNPSRLIISPEKVGRKPGYAINNLCFLRALQLARDAELKHFFFGIGQPSFRQTLG